MASYNYAIQVLMAEKKYHKERMRTFSVSDKDHKTPIDLTLHYRKAFTYHKTRYESVSESIKVLQTWQAHN